MRLSFTASGLFAVMHAKSHRSLSDHYRRRPLEPLEPPDEPDDEPLLLDEPDDPPDEPPLLDEPDDPMDGLLLRDEPEELLSGLLGLDTDGVIDRVDLVVAGDDSDEPVEGAVRVVAGTELRFVPVELDEP